MFSNNTHVVNSGQDVNLYPSSFDLNRLVGNMKQSASWASGELNSIILLNSPSKQVVLTAMQEETEIDYFQENDSVTLQIIEGALEFYSMKESLTLRKGQFYTLDSKEKYNLTTLEKTFLLMTILRGSSEKAETERAVSSHS